MLLLRGLGAVELGLFGGRGGEYIEGGGIRAAGLGGTHPYRGPREGPRLWGCSGRR